MSLRRFDLVGTMYVETSVRKINAKVCGICRFVNLAFINLADNGEHIRITENTKSLPISISTSLNVFLLYRPTYRISPIVSRP